MSKEFNLCHCNRIHVYVIWRGAGYYAPAQHGAHGCEHVAYQWVGDGPAPVDTRWLGLGTPVWADVPVDLTVGCDCQPGEV